ncbi:hypothetical protein Y032_0686g1528 [Ancylostoma ceylanicum]|uniref:Homeobox domain-containing protein n=1 Tax=Ancylostoma ceylanicum TaxID=53326 RepID=A0A016WGI4_9BILA|nr:hypothetical protein Y032_0686g1528 [Ancylostoma ceylanicum]
MRYFAGFFVPIEMTEFRKCFDDVFARCTCESVSCSFASLSDDVVSVAGTGPQTTVTDHSVFMVSTCSPTPPTVPGDPLGINFEIMNQISVSPLSSHENENMDNVLHSHSPGLELSIGEITVASAVASEKARVRQQSAMLDKWLMANGGNLYPCREDKEKLAAQMKMTYLQVNRWFANRRRKQTKRTKTVPSPASVTPAPVSQESTSRPTTPVLKENVMTQLTPDVISAFAQGESSVRRRL